MDHNRESRSVGNRQEEKSKTMNEITAHLERDDSLNCDCDPGRGQSLDTPLKGDKSFNRATDTDRYVGNRIRERRIMLGLS